MKMENFQNQEELVFLEIMHKVLVFQVKYGDIIYLVLDLKKVILCLLGQILLLKIIMNY